MVNVGDSISVAESLVASEEVKIHITKRSFHATFQEVKELENTKQKGNVAFTSGKNEEALKLYRTALLICPNNKLTNAKLHANIAAVYMKLRNYEEAVKVSSMYDF